MDHNTSSGPILVIGYGNTLRRDDGLGPLAADLVAARGWPGVSSLSVHQLLPELADPIASARLVVFVDIRIADDHDAVRVEPIRPRAGRGGPTAHESNPASLLAMARAVFGRCPEAWLVSVPASDLGLGEGLSPQANRGLDDALTVIEQLLQERPRSCQPTG